MVEIKFLHQVSYQQQQEMKITPVKSNMLSIGMCLIIYTGTFKNEADSVGTAHQVSFIAII